MKYPKMHIDDETWLWIAENHNADVDRLRLSAHGDEDKMFAITQIDCRRRTRRKLGATLAHVPRFIFPSTLAAQQSTSDALAAFHASLVGNGDRVIDMTGGLGIDALHIAQNASSVAYYELNPLTAECAAYNFRMINADNIAVHCADSVASIRQMAKDEADVIFIDPARRGDDGRRLFALSDCMPDVTKILDSMLYAAPEVIIKASPMLDVSAVLRELHSVRRVVALGTVSECKELLIICERGFKGEPMRECHTLDPDSGVTVSKIEYYKSEDDKAQLSFASPVSGNIIYEPYPSTSKIGIRALLCKLTGARRLAPDTDFYCSEFLLDSFPGLALEIVEGRVMSKKAIKEVAAKYPAIDVTVKNFTMTASELTRKLHCRPNGRLRLIACSDSEGQKHLFVCRPVGAVNDNDASLLEHTCD